MDEEQSDQIAKAELAEIESEHYIQYQEWQRRCEQLWNEALKDFRSNND